MSHWLDIVGETLIVAWFAAIFGCLFVYWREKNGQLMARAHATC
jgi:hypothetical protein